MKKIVAKYMFKRLAKNIDSNRERAVVNLSEAQSVGILFFDNNAQTKQQVEELIAYLKQRNIKAKALGYVNQKELDDKHKSNQTYTYFSNKDCNWYGKPKGPVITKFVKTPFSILIDLTLKERSALKFISGMSMAKLKVGVAHNQSADLMIDISKNKTLAYFIEELKHYLNLINKQNGTK